MGSHLQQGHLQYAVAQSQFQQKAAEQQVLTDVRNAYEGLRSGEEVVQLYGKGYFDQATQLLEITRFPASTARLRCSTFSMQSAATA